MPLLFSLSRVPVTRDVAIPVATLPLYSPMKSLVKRQCLLDVRRADLDQLEDWPSPSHLTDREELAGLDLSGEGLAFLRFHGHCHQVARFQVIEPARLAVW